MPYVKQERRELIDNYLEELLVFLSENDVVAGDLNYIYTKINKEYIDRAGKNYQNFNNLMGALEGAKLELYRRQISGYEDLKAIENGDVY